MRYKGTLMRTLLFGLILFSLPLFAGELKSREAQLLADQLVKSINQKIADIAALEIAAGVAPEDVKILLSQHKRFDSGRFGAILDANEAGKVISVTPKSQASMMGLRSGDIIVAVNGQALDAENKVWQSQLQYTKNDTKVRLTVKRDASELLMSSVFKAKYTPQWQLLSSKELLLSAKFKAKYIPYWELTINAPIFAARQEDNNIPKNIDGCGRVIIVNSVSISPSRSTGLRDTAVIKEIDGDTLVRGASRYRLTAGSHYLKIINRNNLKSTSEHFKIALAPNTSYYIAYAKNAKWVDEAGKNLDEGKYTGPVIWKTKKQACQL